MATFSPANRPYDAIHYQINLSIDPSVNPDVFEASVDIKLKTLQTVEKLSFDMKELSVHSVKLGGKQPKDLLFKSSEKTLEVEFPKAVAKGQVLTLAIRYAGKVRSTHDGFFKVWDPDEPERGALLFTHFEAQSARSFFPCNDEPYDKATTEVRVRVPARYAVISNGQKTSDRPFKREGADWREVRWLQDKPHSTYLVSLAVGEFSKIASKGKPEISVWVGKSKVENARFTLEITQKAVAFFEKYLGVKYPWAKYATIGLPTYLWGGMENTSATHMNQERTVLNEAGSSFEKKRIVGLATHELAHQWFGNDVTPKWWDDIWLNEAFASYLDSLATAHIIGSEEAAIELVTHTWDDYFRQEDGPRSHPIVAKELTNPDDAFDSISYTKGENVLRMLSFYLGEEKFRASLREYLKQFKRSNANYLDFFRITEKITGEDLALFRDTWLLQRGYPVIRYSGEWDPKSSTYTLSLSQRSNHESDKSSFHFRLPIVFHRSKASAYSRTVILSVSEKNTDISLVLPAEPEWVTVNPGGVVLGKVIPAKTDETVLALQAVSDPDPVARVWACFQLSENFLEGRAELSKEAESTVLNILQSDSSPYVRMALLAAFRKMKTRWLTEKIGSGILALARNAFQNSWQQTADYRNDPHGWSELRSELLGTLGKVSDKTVLNFLSEILQNPALALDDLQMAANAVAQVGDKRSAEILHSTLSIHKPRGYRYQYWIQFAFGAYQSPMAAAEIRKLSETGSADLFGRINLAIRDNQVLRTSPEWAVFLQEFLLKNGRFNDEVKTRILSSVEDVNTKHAKALLVAVIKESKSERLREASKKILDKNFPERVVTGK
ncbi:MAG: hypothetical protein HY537_14190 [Deltaproteobacteria bacterium]|nr:hypothetical protein [Deltaproteobacteria bacterium]